MGTSVGAKALNIRSALILAGIMEFAGVLLIGRVVSESIGRSFVDIALWPDQFLFVLGMAATLLASFLWLLIATLLSLPVSTTHTIVSGVCAFALLQNSASVNVDRIVTVLISWVVSPLIGLVVSFLLYFAILRIVVLNNSTGDRINKFLLPILCGLTLAVMIGIVLIGVSRVTVIETWIIITVFFVVWLIVYLLVFFLFVPAYEQRPNRFLAVTRYVSGESTEVLNSRKMMGMFNQSAIVLTPTKLPTFQVQEGQDLATQMNVTAVSNFGSVTLNGMDLNLARYDFLQRPYAFLMICTAALVAFGHGANDSANAVGPFSVCLEWALTGMLSTPVQASPIWVYVAAGVALVVGLLTLGYRVIRTVGEKIARLSYLQGFCAQFSTALIVVIASLLGLPISTTHCIIGSVTGVALVTIEGRSTISGRMLGKIALGWLFTVVIGAGLTMLIFVIFKAAWGFPV